MSALRARTRDVLMFFFLSLNRENYKFFFFFTFVVMFLCNQILMLERTEKSPRCDTEHSSYERKSLTVAALNFYFFLKAKLIQK